MTDITHQTAVVVIPPESCWEPIQAIRREHDKQVHRWMPHISMLYPFRPRCEFESAARSLSAVCGAIRSFEVTLAEFKYFYHGGSSYTLWLAPDPADPLMDLQAAMLSAVPECDETSRYATGFTPHLSVGQVRDAKQMERFKDQLQAAWQPLIFRVDSVSLIWRGDPPDDVFRIDRTIPLGPVRA